MLPEESELINIAWSILCVLHIFYFMRCVIGRNCGLVSIRRYAANVGVVMDMCSWTESVCTWSDMFVICCYLLKFRDKLCQPWAMYLWRSQDNLEPSTIFSWICFLILNSCCDKIFDELFNNCQIKTTVKNNGCVRKSNCFRGIVKG